MGTEVVPQQAWQYGALGVVCVLFVIAIVYLFKRYEKRERGIEKDRAEIISERASWLVERQRYESERESMRDTLRAEFEEKHRELLEQFVRDLRDEREGNRQHEDGIRREYAELMEAVEGEAQRASQALVELLQKFYDRFVGPRPRY